MHNKNHSSSITLSTALQRYLDLMQKQSYFDAHEVLEEAWHPLRKAKDPIANLLKGLINAAIAFEHIKRNSVNAKTKAKKVMLAFDRYVVLYHKDIIEEELMGQACRIVEQHKHYHQEVFDVLVS